MNTVCYEGGGHHERWSVVNVVCYERVCHEGGLS